MDQETELLELSGSIESIIYKNEENGYTVLRLRDGNDQIHTVVGTFPYAAQGERLILSGTWMTHSVHGKQFKAEFAQRLMPVDETAIYEYLAGGSVKGIGPATASLLVHRFGDKTLEILENAPEELAKIKGIGPAKAEQICRSFRKQTGVRRLMEFVCSFGLRPVLAMRMYKYYGDEALDVLRENPYIVTASHIGGSFGEADHLAQEMGMDEHSPARIQAAVRFELRHNCSNGHCFIPREKLAASTAQLIGVEESDAEEQIRQLSEQGLIVCEDIAKVHACYLPELYEAETDAAQRLAHMSLQRFDEHVDLNALLRRIEERQKIHYAQNQREILKLALEHQLVVLTGGPGTGKTTALRAIIEMFDQIGLKTLLAAPTGRAAKRMTELSGRESSTVHRLLEAKFAEDGARVIFGRDENEPLDCGAVILDECSMVDILLLDSLLRAMPADARLVLVGDADQLPSVGPGNVFSAIIRSEVVPKVCLTEIFRQNEGSRIVRNAHMINRGEHPDLSENSGDFFRLKRLQAAGTVETVTELVSKRLPEKMHIPSGDIQVLSPTRKGELGTAALNKRLQEVLNPPDKKKREKAFGDATFREGDRVMQIRNNYDITWRNTANTAVGSGIYNGDIGRILQIDPDGETLTVDFDGRIAEYSFDTLNELEHAWAMTVHKAQGSEYRAVILALSNSSPMLLTRDLLYTAVTRARELLILVGDDATAYRMIDNFRQTRRYSALRVRLRQLRGL